MCCHCCAAFPQISLPRCVSHAREIERHLTRFPAGDTIAGSLHYNLFLRTALCFLTYFELSIFYLLLNRIYTAVFCGHLNGAIVRAGMARKTGNQVAPYSRRAEARIGLCSDNTQLRCRDVALFQKENGNTEPPRLKNVGLLTTPLFGCRSSTFFVVCPTGDRHLSGSGYGQQPRAYVHRVPPHTTLKLSLQ